MEWPIVVISFVQWMHGKDSLYMCYSSITAEGIHHTLVLHSIYTTRCHHLSAWGYRLLNCCAQAFSLFSFCLFVYFFYQKQALPGPNHMVFYMYIYVHAYGVGQNASCRLGDFALNLGHAVFFQGGVLHWLFKHANKWFVVNIEWLPWLQWLSGLFCYQD